MLSASLNDWIHFVSVAIGRERLWHIGKMQYKFFDFAPEIHFVGLIIIIYSYHFCELMVIWSCLAPAAQLDVSALCWSIGGGGLEVITAERPDLVMGLLGDIWVNCTLQLLEYLPAIISVAWLSIVYGRIVSTTTHLLDGIFSRRTYLLVNQLSIYLSGAFLLTSSLSHFEIWYLTL